ncbi:MAG: hypothetical protein ACXWAT_10460, partial [Methylobacter sp.]
LRGLVLWRKLYGFFESYRLAPTTGVQPMNRSVLIKLLANTKWSELPDDVLAQIAELLGVEIERVTLTRELYT